LSISTYKTLILALLLITQISWASAAQTYDKQPAPASINEYQKQLFSIINHDLNIQDIAKHIWKDLLGGELLDEINTFKKRNPIPFEKFEDGATWASLKGELDVNMNKPIPGADYSWEQFRGMDKIFNENLVNKALEKFGLKPVKWAAAGSVGYNSDIDNVAMGTSSYQEVIAKILADTLHIYMYGNTSEVTFDEQVYTHHPGASLQTLRNITLKEEIEKYQKVAFSLAQLQIYRNLKHSKTLPWEQYKIEFTHIFPEVADVLNSVQQYDRELEKVTTRDRETIKEKMGLKVPPPLTEINALLDLKAITVLSQQMLSHVRQEQKLQDSLTNEEKKIAGQKPVDEDLARIIEAANKEKEDLLIQTALLFALCETYYPEGYYTQEAFQLVVMGDQPISQMLSNMVNDYMKNGNPEKFKTVDELREHLVKTNRDSLFAITPFAHLISMGEQLGYFIHKIGTGHGQTPQTFSRGAKYLYRFAFSFQKIVDYFKNNREAIDKLMGSPYDVAYPELSQKFASRLNHIAEVLYVFQRGKIYISQERLAEEIHKFIKYEVPEAPEALRDEIAAEAAEYLIYKGSVAVLTPDERAQAFAAIFSEQRHEQHQAINRQLGEALNVQITKEGLTTSQENMTLVMNALLSKSRADNAVIKKHYERELSHAFEDLDLNESREIDALLKGIVKGYMYAVKIFFMLPGQQFNPYSLNYNEIHLGHTYNPETLVPEGK